MNVDKLFRILGIKYSIRHRGNNDSVYVVKCPYCSSGSHKHRGDSGAFLEYNNKLRYTCWRGCSSSVVDVLCELSGESVQDVKEALSLCSSEYKKQYEGEEKKDVFVLPEDIGLTQKYRDYLSYRGVDADYVTKKYNLRFTPPFYAYKGMNMSNTIVFPIYNMNGRPVSFTARTTSPTAVIRYLFPKACDEEEAGKDLGWGHNGIENKDFVVITEGIFDALKLDSVGIPAVACLGINYNTGFVNTIVKNYKSACVIFDPEPQAQKQQTKLINELSLLIQTTTIKFPFQHDLGDCSYGELKTIKELIKNKKNF
jgi:hypothetical protein